MKLTDRDAPARSKRSMLGSDRCDINVTQLLHHVCSCSAGPFGRRSSSVCTTSFKAGSGGQSHIADSQHGIAWLASTELGARSALTSLQKISIVWLFLNDTCPFIVVFSYFGPPCDFLCFSIFRVPYRSGRRTAVVAAEQPRRRRSC